ncbi:MAG TPA: hypothetical protein VJT72_11245 [Pseudonocardiaceae bacterium]|nr:hypothetical protein [Pseudonocardiaceae bacterium]
MGTREGDHRVVRHPLSGPTYGIFDVFLDDSARDAHLSGKVAEVLMAQAPDLFDDPPKIEKPS